MIRKETHTRSKFASQQYYKFLNEFSFSNLLITEGKLNHKHFKYLSGVAVRKLPIKLAQALRVYDHYNKEYNDTLTKLNEN